MYMHQGLHYVIRHSHTNKNHGRLINLLDKFAYLMGGLTVLVNIPQLISVWTAPDTQGVSVVSWTGFLLGSCFWVIYGALHKEKPIITINATLIIIQGLIVIGILTR